MGEKRQNSTYAEDAVADKIAEKTLSEEDELVDYKIAIGAPRQAQRRRANLFSVDNDTPPNLVEPKEDRKP